MHGGDLTRSTFDAARRFSGVRLQQGRVQLDADWNEQLDIAAHRDRAHVVDTVGPNGVPKSGGGFAVAVSPDGGDLLLSPGRGWVEGTLCESGAERTGAALSGATATVASVMLDGSPLTVHDWVLVEDGAGTATASRLVSVDTDTREAELESPPLAPVAPVTMRRLASYAVQPDLPGPDHTQQASAGAPRVLDLADGLYLAYLDVWERSVTALDVPEIREKALGGPDTATRDRTVWQLRLLELDGAAGDVDCDSDLSEWTDVAFASPTGTMAARAETPADEVDLCTPTPAGGYTGLENQLFRVQVHGLAGDGSPRILWSRENASIETTWQASAGAELTVSGIGPDDVRGFAGDQWVELVDDARLLAAQPGTLVRLLKAEGSTLTVDPTSADGSLARADFGSGAKVRRWDSDGVVTATTDTWVNLENGVQVRFTPGTYRLGDYWLVAARSAVADVDWPRDPEGRSLSRPADGVEHARAHLALVRSSGGTLTTTDCRSRFPSLTTLTASDVGFDDAVCDLTGVGTVQEAIDRLCQQHDLRRHHKLLHGWGIVCGLQVHCGPNEEKRRNVTVLPGSAIDSEGNDVDLTRETVIDILERIERLQETLPADEKPVLDENGDGDVCLSMRASGGGRPRFDVTKMDPDTGSTRNVLNGTLLLDFYDDCIKSLHEWLQDEFQPPEDEQGLPVGPARQLASAVSNLIAQPVNPRSGRNIFISPREDKLLQRFYKGLRERLQSETFCAMFEGARTPPDYPTIVEGLDTIFGTGAHNRVRMRPGGTEAWSVGPGLNPLKPVATINRYDLQAGRLIEVIDPIAGVPISRDTPVETGTAAVSDVAFSPDGRTVYVTIPTRNEDNTIVRVGRLGRAGGAEIPEVHWEPMVTICGVKLVTLATTAADPKFFYAIGHRKVTVTRDGKQVTEWHGAGLYRIDPVNIDPDARPLPVNVFPVGHLVITDAGQALLTAMSGDTEIGNYTQIAQVRVPEGVEFGPRIALPSGGKDDLAVVALRSPRVTVACVVVSTGSTKSVLTYEVGNGALIGDGNPVEVSRTKGTVRVLGAADMFAVVVADEYALKLVGPTSGALVDRYLLPMQVGPVALTTATSARSVLVLNYVSNTLSVVPNELLSPETRADLAALAAYRAGMLEAFSDLLGGFLQYLKDCLFDHFLVRCPQPTGEETLFLAGISVRGRQVYRVCNFSKRRYVKSFPLVGYWLSVVPILPMLGTQFVRLACSVIVEKFAGLSVDDDSQGRDRVSVDQLQQLLQFAQSRDLPSNISDLRGRASAVPDVLRSALVPSAPRPTARGGPIVTASAVGQPVDVVAENLRKRGVTVRQEAVGDDSNVSDVATSLPAFFRDAKRGDEVTLYEDGGRVSYFGVQRAESVRRAARGGEPSEQTADVQALVARLESLEAEVARLRARKTSARKRSPEKPSE